MIYHKARTIFLDISANNIQQFLRLTTVFIMLSIGIYSLIHGYEAAYYDEEHILLRPDGNEQDYIYVFVAALCFIACLLGRRLFILSWAMAAYAGWWSFWATSYYLNDQYFVMGRDGCLWCDDVMTELHLSTTLYALACGCWMLMFRRPSGSYYGKISVFVVLWLIVSFAVCVQDN